MTEFSVLIHICYFCIQKYFVKLTCTAGSYNYRLCPQLEAKLIEYKEVIPIQRGFFAGGEKVGGGGEEMDNKERYRAMPIMS